MDSSPVPHPPESPMPGGQSRARRRRTGIILKSSPFAHDVSTPADGPSTPGTSEESPNVSLIRPKTVRIADEKMLQDRATSTKSLSVAPKGSQPGQEKIEIVQGLAILPSVSNRNGLFDAKSEKSHSYLTAGGKAMKSSMLYQESANQCSDVVEARRKLRQLQINYSKTNANLNDRVIMCDILKVTFHQVIPRIKLMNALERRLHNLRLRSRRRILAMGEDTRNMTKTISELKKEREERIKNKQRPPRKVDTLKTISAEDIEKLKTCRYLRISDV